MGKAKKKARPQHPYVVTVKGGVVTPARMVEDEHGEMRKQFEDGLLDLVITGEVCVEAPNQRAAKKRAIDLLYGNEVDGESLGPVLSLEDGEAVDFEVVSVRRLYE